MLDITATPTWRATHPGATIGLLEISGTPNLPTSPALEDRKRVIETRLREQYAGFTRQDFLAIPVISAYDRYYTRFNKTYHVQLQLESIVLKGKNLPAVSPLVDANFMAETQTLLLSAGHDADRLSPPITIDTSQEGESITQMNGSRKEIRAGDMVMRDATDISCSILYGQDNRSPISAQTTRVLYVTYAPPGILPEQVEAHLDLIRENVRLFSPSSVVEQLCLLTS
jgi:DNA/RNA-binding domain of Phe-tRNA-synthetase-like protein